MIKHLKRLWQREDGMSSVEFCLTFPFVFYFFGLGAEIGLYQLQQVMFERGVDIVVRQLRLGDESLQDTDTLIAAICDETLVVASCTDNLHLDMQPIEVSSYRGTETEVTCINRTEEVRPVVTMVPGSGDEVMVMRFCMVIDPVFANWGLGKIMPRVEGGGVPLYAQTFYVNEP